MEEGLTTEHSSELLANAGEDFLNGGGVADEGSSHLETTRRDIAHGGHDVVGDPGSEVGGVLGLDIEHLLVNFLGGHTAAERGNTGEIETTTGIAGSHHVLVIEHLGGELGDGEGTIDLGSAGGKRSETSNVEVHTDEGLQVDIELTEVGVELAWEAEAAGDTRHNQGDEVVQVTEGGAGELEGTEAYIIKGLVINAEDLISRLDQLVDGEGTVVGFNDSIGNLGRGDDGESGQDTVWILFTELGEHQGTHTGTGTTTEGVAELEALEAITGLSFFADGVENGIDEFSAFGIITLGPVVTSSGLTEDKVVGTEELAEWAGTDRIHGTGLEIDEDGTGDITTTGGFIVIDVDTLDLEFRVSAIFTGRVYAVLVRNDLPELGTDLVTTLACLDMYDFSHVNAKVGGGECGFFI